MLLSTVSMLQLRLSVTSHTSLCHLQKWSCLVLFMRTTWGKTKTRVSRWGGGRYTREREMVAGSHLSGVHCKRLNWNALMPGFWKSACVQNTFPYEYIWINREISWARKNQNVLEYIYIYYYSTTKNNLSCYSLLLLLHSFMKGAFY